MRVVLDANVLISAATSRGPSHRIVQAWLQDQTFELVICDRLLGEVRSVLTERPRLRKWISLEAAELYVTTLATVADVQPDPAPGPALTRDPDDDYLLHLARALGADFVVSGDADLLVGRAGPSGDPAGGVRGGTESVMRATVSSWAAAGPRDNRN